MAMDPDTQAILQLLNIFIGAIGAAFIADANEDSGGIIQAMIERMKYLAAGVEVPEDSPWPRC